MVISELVGLRPRADNILEVNPLLPADQWDWFCLDNIKYHDKIITILWDKTGFKYGRGKGLMIFADTVEILHSENLTRVLGVLE